MSLDPFTSNRRYRFWLHGRPTRGRRQRRPEQVRDRLHPSNLPSMDRAFAWVCDHENLLAVYKQLRCENGRAPGPDGLRFADVTIREMAAMLRQVACTIRSGSYHPSPTRAVYIPKQNGKRRRLDIAGIIDRTVAAATNLALRPHWENVLLDCCYGCRPGRNVYQLLADLERTVVIRNSPVLVIADIQDAFGNVSIPAVMQDFGRHTGDRQLLALNEAVLRGYNPDSNNRKEVGIPQGNPLSPQTLNVKVHYTLDLPWTNGNHPPLYRWVDDMPILTESVPEGRDTRAQLAELLSRDDFKLKQTDTEPVLDLRENKAQLLGYMISLDVTRQQLRIELGSNTWVSLEKSLRDAHSTVEPSKTATAVVSGWLEAAGATTESANGDQMLRRIAWMMKQYGFQEAISWGAMRKAWQQACKRWQAIRSRAKPYSCSTC